MENENDNLVLDEKIENADSENGGQSEDNSEDNSKKEEPEYSDRERKLFARAKNNEDAAKLLREQGFERKDGQWLKPTPQEPLKPQSNEPDYAKLAFLKSEGIIHSDDQKLVQDEAARLKLPLTDILQMAHIKTQLETVKDQREAMAGMPKGRGQAGGKTQQDVDYWVQKDEVPEDLELAEKVINAKMKKDDSNRMFDPLTK